MAIKAENYVIEIENVILTKAQIDAVSMYLREKLIDFEICAKESGDCCIYAFCRKRTDAYQHEENIYKAIQESKKGKAIYFSDFLWCEKPDREPLQKIYVTDFDEDTVVSGGNVYPIYDLEHGCYSPNFEHAKYETVERLNADIANAERRLDLVRKKLAEVESMTEQDFLG